MKKHLFIFITVIICCMSAVSVKAQEFDDDFKGWVAEWKYSFSKEGIEKWKPEFTARYGLGIYAWEVCVTAGVRVDEKRTFGFMVEHHSNYLDYAPGNLYSMSTELFMRRYFHIGPKKRFAFYNDLSLGVGWIYKVTGKYRTNPETLEREEIIPEDPGKVYFAFGWQPGFRVRIYKNLHIFLGGTMSTGCIGGHIGIGF